MKSAIYLNGHVLSGSQANKPRNAWKAARLIIRNTFGVEFKYCGKYLIDNKYYCSAWPKR